ncbi:MAG: polyphosphate kinase 1 [Gaiellaceae bacterium]
MASVPAAMPLLELPPAPINAPPRRFLNREVSWIDFDRRVLELAADPDLPLLERIRYCAIASSNLDEFFAVRVADLFDQADAGVTRHAPDGCTPAETLAQTRDAIGALQSSQDRLWHDELQPALARQRIRICKPDSCRARELRVAGKHFEREVVPLLTPMAVERHVPFPHVPSLGINLAVVVGDQVNGRLLCISLPPGVPRFIDTGERGVRLAVEDVLLHFLSRITGSDEVTAACAFRITRDADIDVASDADDLMEALETSLRRRRFGDVVRVELPADAPEPVRTRLLEGLGIDQSRVYTSSAPLGLAALAEIAAIGRRDLARKRWRPVTAEGFARTGGTTLLARIRRRDLLAHHPYDAYDTSVERFVSASGDSKVAALKATVYRTGNPSGTVASLVEASERGKQAVCLVELRARFDERRNIEWSRALERAGVHVVYGAPDSKVHAKLSLVVRRERDGLRRYAHIGTGNYHASNASTYEDLSLFTADEDITADVADVFNAVTGDVTPPVFRKLLVAPWFLRSGLMSEIARVAAAAEAGEPARIRVKVNALVDTEIADALYAAARAGARVEAVTRGICVLRPGVAGLSEGITVRCVLGPFLEHSRILSFHAGNKVSTWIGSADLMPRNLDRRVEVLAPVEDAKLRARIDSMLDALLADTRFSWELGADGTWTRVRPSGDEAAVSAQELLMHEAASRSKKRR